VQSSDVHGITSNFAKKQHFSEEDFQAAVLLSSFWQMMK